MDEDELYYAQLALEDELDYEAALDAAEAERERLELAYAYEPDYMEWHAFDQE